jgi:hypothetical protein
VKTESEVRSPKSEVRSRGRVYTPPTLAETVVSAALEALGDCGGRTLRVLDPAVGEGVFLDFGVRGLAPAFPSAAEASPFCEPTPASGDRESREDQRRSFKAGASPRTPKFTLTALDTDPAAVAVARSRLPEADIRVGDFLLPRPQWDGAFDLIVGNPPFVRVHRLDAETRRSLRAGSFRLLRGDCDLYIAFFERAVPMLRPGGVLAFVSSDKFLSREYGRPLREFLLRECEPVRVADLSRTPGLFDADVYPLVSIWRKRGKGEAGDGLADASGSCDGSGARDGVIPATVCHRPEDVPAALLGPPTRFVPFDDWLAGRWAVSDGSSSSGETWRTLGEVPGLELFCGTPRAKDYPHWSRFLRTGEPTAEGELPLITCGQVRPFVIDRSRPGRTLGRPAVAPRLAFPEGHVSAAMWERFRRPGKVLIRCNDRRVTAAVAEGPAACVGLYAATAAMDPHTLAALLNSPVSQDTLRREAAALRVGGGYYSLTAPVLRRLPVPEPPADLSAALSAWARRRSRGEADDAEAVPLWAEAYRLPAERVRRMQEP